MIHTAIVKDNTDATGNGRIRVYVPEIGGDPTLETSWYVVSPMSPHAGNTNPYSNTKGGKKDMQSQDAYGTWASGYSLENEVIVSFVNGDMTRGVVMGGVFQQNMSNSIAGYPSGKSNQGTTRGVHPPVVEYNKRDDDISPRAPIRPRRELLAEQLKKQGLFRDFQRGQHSTSLQRDAVPQFTSIKSPRGASIVMDDGKLDTDSGAGVDQRNYTHPNAASSYQSIRSSRGAQMMIDNGCGYVYMNSPDGGAFQQIADSGITLYSAKNMTWRGKGGISIKVDGNYNEECVGNYTIKAVGPFGMEIGGKFDIYNPGTGISYEAAAMVSVKSASTFFQADDTLSKTGGASLIEQAGTISDNSVSPGAAKDAADAAKGSAQDRESAGCNAKKETLTTVPAGGLATHEPTATHSTACGSDGGAAGENCSPTSQQPMGDGSSASVDANPPDECGNSSEGDQGEYQASYDGKEHFPDDGHHDHDNDDLETSPQFVSAARNVDLRGVNPTLVDKVRLAAGDVGMEEIGFNSGFRDPARNAAAGGAKKSQHMVGNAVDINVGNMSQQQRVNFIQALSDRGVTGIGVYNNAIHADVRPGARAAWGPNFKSGSTPSWARPVLKKNGYL